MLFRYFHDLEYNTQGFAQTLTGNPGMTGTLNVVYRKPTPLKTELRFEAKVDRVKPGLRARLQLQDNYLEGAVFSVASIAKPAGWWTGNVVKYDTIIELPKSVDGLKPGMSVEVEVVIARHDDVLTVPAAAVLETHRGYCCWVETEAGVERRTLQLGDANDMAIVVQDGLDEGDEVVLNPLAHLQEAQDEAQLPENAKSGKLNLSDL